MIYILLLMMFITIIFLLYVIGTIVSAIDTLGEYKKKLDDISASLKDLE